jgi:hypothetical protein
MQHKFAIVRECEGHLRIRDGMQPQLLLHVRKFRVFRAQNLRRAGTLKKAILPQSPCLGRRRDPALR